ncbi:MAG: signal peptidase II [Candidatus Sericytochromatia bacterium]|nr:signal peptidase II [Candidatus Sericytochromatia bacterium]
MVFQFPTPKKIPRLVFLFLALGVLLVDQASKYPFRSSWLVGQSQPLTDWLWLTYVQNTGALAGIFSGNAFVLGLVSLVISLGIVWYAWRLESDSGWLPYLSLGFLLGGATGNMLDRILFGFVVDMFDFRWQGQNVWPVFNVADIAIDIAIALFVLMALPEFWRDLGGLRRTGDPAEELAEALPAPPSEPAAEDTACPVDNTLR